MIFPIPGGKKIGSHYLPRYTRYRVIAGRVIKGGHCIMLLYRKVDTTFCTVHNIGKCTVCYMYKMVQLCIVLSVLFVNMCSHSFTLLYLLKYIYMYILYSVNTCFC